MRFTIAAAALVGAASASYGYGYPANTTSEVTYPTETPSEYPAPSDVYVTKTTTALTTYCPGPTTIEQGGKTYTVTEATTLTITDCPCTVIETPSYTPAPPAETPYVPSAPAPSAPAPVYPSSNGTTVVPVYPTGTGVSPSSTAPPEFPGAASQAGVGLLAVVGALAAFL